MNDLNKNNAGVPSSASGSCRKYTAEQVVCFVRGQVAQSAAESFLEHVNECDECRSQLAKKHNEEAAARDRQENELLLKRSMDLLQSLDESFLSIMVKAARGVVELLRTTGEAFVQAPAPAGVRSSTGDMEPQDQPVRITKEFAESCLSVEVTIIPQQPETVGIRISLLDTRAEQFLADIRVTCEWEGGSESSQTDSDGVVDFVLPAGLTYEFEIRRDEHLLGTIALDVMKEG